jgi:hypothetical protein
MGLQLIQTLIQILTPTLTSNPLTSNPKVGGLFLVLRQLHL